ncbi:tenascin-X-like [Penaeus monodon]|uniref:tenascin-X-like n=1 Tax=Penaeus monodon TaxID=6687 RepID=UPI0018A7DDA5|nr:tenascin-X-like [Penaeus monodon]
MSTFFPKSSCDDIGCSCCLDCTREVNCTAQRGVCRQNCLNAESELPNGCTGFNANVVFLPKVNCPDTPATCRGKCVDDRECGVNDRIVNSACTGEFCTCCIDCTELTNCTAERGVCRQTCLTGESEVENGCSGFNCKCCRPADETCPATPATCRGMCKDSRRCAAADRIANSTCTGENCTCCINCTIQANCPAERGVCRQTLFVDLLRETCPATPATCRGMCKDDRRCAVADRIANSTCTGEFCTCCINCTELTNCTAERGVCRQTCLTGESEVENGCSGFNCKCCRPADETCPATPATCRGMCKDSRRCAAADRIANSTCTGEFCTCCINCTIQANCTVERGVCRQTCLTGESEVENGCTGFNCKCCRPADETCPATPATCRGKCKDDRRCAVADRIANSTCTGEFCTCCINCNELTNCTAERGVCRQTCLTGESEVENGCTGFNCKCCRPADETCPATPATCRGMCKDSRRCAAADRIANSTCTGDFCMCCIDCTPLNNCTAQRGVCKQTCAQGETEINNGCSGFGCKCCSPPPATCPATSTCQAQCVDSRQCEAANLIAGSTCTGENWGLLLGQTYSKEAVKSWPTSEEEIHFIAIQERAP